jgi:hypothetical protein
MADRFELPGEQPALFAFFMARIGEREQEEEFDPESELRSIVDVLFGGGAFDRFLATGASFEAIGRLIGVVRGLYTERQQEDGQGEADAPEAGASPSPTSRSGSRSSKRTSSASTRSTSPKRSKAG